MQEFADSLDNIRAIFRGEVQLAKGELHVELARVASASLLVGLGALIALISAMLFFCACVLALSLVMPAWGAALLSGASAAILSLVALTAGLKRFKTIRPDPGRTVANLKEIVEWARQMTR